MDSETRVQNLHVGGDTLFPDTRNVSFVNDDKTLYELLRQKAPLGADRLVPVEYLPEAFVRNTYFSGAKISLSSNVMLAERDVEQYIALDQKFYDYDGYIYSQKSPPGGYKFCVIREGVYGVGLHLKFKLLSFLHFLKVCYYIL